MKRFCIVISLLSVICFGCGPQRSEDSTEASTLLVKVPRSEATPELLAELEFHPDHGFNPDYLIGYVNTEAWHRASLPFSAEVLDEKAWIHGGYDPNTLDLIETVNIAKIREGYHNYQSLTAELERLRDAYPTYVRLETAGRSVQGREIWYVIITAPGVGSENRPKFIYHANMHGDEVVGRELMIYLIRHLLENVSADERIQQILSNAQLFVMPSMNPDGFELGRRENARGRDLNRNFPDRFESPNDTPEGRQVEVQHMMELARRNHFVYGINWHGGEICFNLPWGNIRNRPENKHWDDVFYYPIGREYTQLNQPMHENHHDSFDHGLTYGFEWYPVYGGIDDWFNYYRGSLHAVVELSRTKWPSASTLAGFWEDNREAMLSYLWRGLRGLHLHVISAEGADISNASVVTPGYKHRSITYSNAWIHRLSGDGSHEITVSAPGFAERTLRLDATYLNGDYQEVVLERQ